MQEFPLNYNMHLSVPTAVPCTYFLLLLKFLLLKFLENNASTDG